MKIEQELQAAFSKPVILFDDQSTKIGYFMGLGASVEADQVNFMIQHGRGLVYVCITEENARRLSLPGMMGSYTYDSAPVMAVSVDHKTNSTGISAFDRADTIRAFADDKSAPEDFRRPGHLFPIIVRQMEGGRRCESVPEASLYLANLASGCPVSYICEILNEQGEIASQEEVEKLARQHQISIFTLSDVNEWMLKQRVREMDDLSFYRRNIHVPDLDFAHECEQRFGINRGIYNVIDSWFFEQGVTNILARRTCILQFLSAQMRQVKPGGTLRFGHGGLPARLREFWSKMSS